MLVQVRVHLATAPAMAGTAAAVVTNLSLMTDELADDEEAEGFDAMDAGPAAEVDGDDDAFFAQLDEMAEVADTMADCPLHDIGEGGEWAATLRGKLRFQTHRLHVDSADSMADAPDDWSDSDRQSDWEPEVAVEEVKALAANPAPPTSSPPPDAWRHDRMPRSPPPSIEEMAPPPPGVAASFCTANDVRRRRWQRLLASPASLGDVPEDLYPAILVHVPPAGLACLALASREWGRAVSVAMQTEQQWDSISNGLATCRGRIALATCRGRIKQLYSALCTLCDGPAACVELISGMSAAADKVDMDIAWCSPSELFRFVAKCPRAFKWTPALVVEVVQARSLNTGTIEDFEDAHCFAADLEDAFCSLYRYSHSRGFAVRFEDVVQLAISSDRVVDGGFRLHFLMGCFGSFFEGYSFNELDGRRLGSFVASCSMPLADVLTLTSMLDEEESAAEEMGSAQEREGTVAFLHAWAEGSNFPSGGGWASGDVHTFIRSMMHWSHDLKRHAMALALGWLQEMLSPLVHVLGESPPLAAALGMIEALQ